MASGVTVHDDVVTQFNDFKSKRPPFNYRYFIYKIENDSVIVIESTAPATDDYGKLYDTLSAMRDECRYALVDLEVTASDGRPTSKMVFISWSPDTAKIKSKMLYASSKEAIKRVLVGVNIHLNATDVSELEQNYVADSIKQYL
ncbi:actin depolymerization factor/cofilin-like domain-containing protein [Nocardia sp. NEAU-G5]|uniref:Actin depolymerization factor/cofilin-like domain-containing protein n=1 Tax=Nocardia albiluteola TaxID=2842303 RepID=A0ABS6B2A6_9NOCA|nr:actin depolymerization factor/cofilin-like domain-containing protein [Nocardia albiluteola]MBU3064422.1 actin depolymerization factor/cofilin-like domain-containing protein [Nocardia albiluteola]